MHQYRLSEGTLLLLFPLHNTRGFDLFFFLLCEITAKRLQKPSQGNSPGSMSQLQQLCLVSLLALSLGNLSVIPVKHQLQIYERLHAISSVWNNETSSNLACFILLQLGNILSNRRQNLFTRWKKKRGGGDIQEDKNSKRLPQEPCFPQWSRAIWKGQFKINGFHRWGFGAPAHAAFQQLEIRKVKLQISDINWRRIQTKLQAISTAEEWFSPEYNNWITGSPFFIQVCG